MRRNLIAIDLGVLDYTSALAEQQRYWQLVVDGETGASASAFLLNVEHPPTITLGRRAQSNAIHLSSQKLAAAKIAVAKVGRGGVATYHAEGQLVCYPILPLRRWRLSVKALVGAMERAMALTANHFGLAAVAGSSQQMPVGTWVGSTKVGAIGVQVKRGVSMHGLALNVTIDLRGFAAIDPCGLGAGSVSSLAHCCQAAQLPIPDLQQARQVLQRELLQQLDARLVRP